MGKEDRITFRLGEKARENLKRVCDLTGLDEPTALRACVQAFIEHIEEHGEIRLPLAIVPKSEVAAPKKPKPPKEMRARAGHDILCPPLESLPVARNVPAEPVFAQPTSSTRSRVASENAPPESPRPRK